MKMLGHFTEYSGGGLVTSLVSV